MYNRYIPQGDGTYQRSRLPESHPPAEQPCPPDRPKPPVPCPPPREEPCSAVSFLQSLLPKNMDTGDLLMLLILLLLIQDGSEDAPTALLTIALFFLL